jgi:hypothetical protein
MAENWDGLVLGDYEVVMPVTWKKKFGISYLYQPFLAAQLGVFGSALKPAIVESFLDAIPRKYRVWDIYLNQKNELSQGVYDFSLRDNFVLELNKTYEDTRAGYSENIIRNIKKAQQSGCYFENNLDSDKVIRLAESQMKEKLKDTQTNISRFRKLNRHLEAIGMSRSYGVFSNDGKLLSSCIFFFSHGRAYYILVGNVPEGRQAGSSHLLIDGFIKENSNSGLLLDFEGSDIPSLARFYGGFGGVIENYAAINYNKLPLLLRWLK